LEPAPDRRGWDNFLFGEAIRMTMTIPRIVSSVFPTARVTV